ncbi:thiamine phosphate synthase [Peribacillus alkalitolerans]|uniref:thiamine phosphate synthase n=1 Tax=Peribacillus alkalitolerans TaxID=1550385 RepID=UPI001F07FB0B|nr:thiamine phosphate synthase [Peribacillus alkalitolerans]
MGSTNCIQNPTEVLKEALNNGVTMVQFREKGIGCLQGDDKLNLAKEWQSLCKKYRVPFIVNDDIELALSIEADGVHIGQEDGNMDGIRKLIGNKFLGVSAHNVEEAQNAVKCGADYLGIGPMFLTHTKPDIREVQGPTVIQSIRASGITIPLVGIGGISTTNFSEVLHAGADGVAVISAISTNPKNASTLSKMVKHLIQSK